MLLFLARIVAIEVIAMICSVASLSIPRVDLLCVSLDDSEDSMRFVTALLMGLVFSLVTGSPPGVLAVECLIVAAMVRIFFDVQKMFVNGISKFLACMLVIDAVLIAEQIFLTVAYDARISPRYLAVSALEIALCYTGVSVLRVVCRVFVDRGRQTTRKGHGGLCDFAE